jgi:hypothetical protein
VHHLTAPLALVLVAHTAATLFMTGVIWFVQVVHYPLFAEVPAGAFARYEQRHTRLTSWVVGPAMLVEAASAGTLLLVLPGARALTAAGAVLLAVIWMSTFLAQVPCHRRLERGFDAAVHRRLVASNWVRTVAWSLRATIALGML